MDCLGGKDCPYIAKGSPCTDCEFVDEDGKLIVDEKVITSEQLNKLTEYIRTAIIPERLACVRDAVMHVLDILGIEMYLR